MIWTLDTGERGPAGCANAEDLRVVLEKARDHHAKTTAEAAYASVMKMANAEDLKDAAKVMLIGERATKAKAIAMAKLPRIQEQMRMGIDAACALAQALGEPCTVTVSGHYSEAHPSGAAKRIQVSIDSLLPQEKEEEI